MSEKQRGAVMSIWEWVVAAFGLLLVLATIAFLVYSELTGRDSPPDVTVQVVQITRQSGGYLLRFEAVNEGGSTAEGAEVEGKLTGPNGATETSTVTLEFLPPHSRRGGGLMFRTDPRSGTLEVRARGYQSL